MSRFLIFGRRADARGTIDLETCREEGVAINTARAIFDSDHSLTMVWVLDLFTPNVAIEVFLREPVAAS